MTIIRPGRLVAALALVAAIAVGAALLRPAASALPPGTAPSGSLHMNPGTGDSETQFSLVFDQLESYCDGDGVAGYRWHTFITSGTNDPATLTFAGTGNPSSGGVGVTLPLRLTSGVIVRAQTPTTVNGSQGFINLPLNLSFSSGAYGALTPGDYWIGVACTAESAVGENVEYWSTAITISASAGAGPNNFTFAPAAPPATTTTTTTTTTTMPTTTTLAGTTTTTTTSPVGATTTSTTLVGGSTTTSTTIAGGASTTSTTLAGAGSSTSTTVVVAAPVVGGGSTGGALGGGSGSGAGPSPQLASTGTSSWQLVIWAALLLVFGRMAILLGRSPKVIDERR